MSGDECEDGELGRSRRRCRVCDGPVKPAQLVCDECDRRDSEEMAREQELYQGLTGIEEPVTVKETAGGDEENSKRKEKGQRNAGNSARTAR